MASIPLKWCERCGLEAPFHRYPIPMHKGVWALVCRKCNSQIARIFASRPRGEWRPSEMYPALYERIRAR